MPHLPELAFSWTVSLGSVLTALTVISVGYGLYIAAKSGGPWRSTAEGTQRLLELEKAKTETLLTQTRTLQEQLVVERTKTDVQPIAQMMGQVTGQVAAVAIHLRDLAGSLQTYRDEIDEHRGDAALVSQAITNTLQEQSLLLRGLQVEVQEHTNSALERHEAIMAELRRPPSTRTRRDDQV